ncbi:Alg9-like mannosyltransferase [Cordyceps fumosorosea ARSEF 2679]|uniref:Mannosyltransferase n=1 Tax=Cordyceps fumosorosea (strain ARSEF 2679) TaxID=1081104 RepID=A0A168CF71_CORFA|nr:Alg9-like mannosyltransferase [Cordyceps fumosorosea ARSEF 2679]OAA71305.1 Alg9-like mannosyltransferase [Cordyceps fumosorosea ARSEF 2679]
MRLRPTEPARPLSHAMMQSNLGKTLQTPPVQWCQSHRRRSRVSFTDVLLVRLVNALSIATFFQPDEYFQSLEPAWDLAFGSESGAWLTWEWHYQLRSSLHPILFAIPYSLVDHAARLLNISPALRSSMLIAAPAILQAVIAALGDWYTLKLAANIYGQDSLNANVALMLQLVSPWQWYCASRTFSNSLEASLTTMALSYWPWSLLGAATTTKENPKSTDPLTWGGTIGRLRICLCLAALAIVLRPTNVLIWITLAGLTVSRLSFHGASPLTLSTIMVLAREAILCGSFILGLSLLADRAYFGFWTLPAHNWLNFNITKSLAVFYGQNPWHYYLLQGIPLLCTTILPFVLPALILPQTMGTAELKNTHRALAAAVIVTVTTLSFISHKEVRFIYPLLPIFSVLAAPRVTSFFTSAAKPATGKGTASKRQVRNQRYLIAGLALNGVLAGYLSYFHQGAPIQVLSFLRQDFERIHNTAKAAQQNHETELFALFLMPCHSTPWRSHLVHPDLHAYALTCDPPLHTNPNTVERDTYRDEADRFYDDPVGFLRRELFLATPTAPAVSIPGGRSPQAVPGLLNPPRYIVGFEGVEDYLVEFLTTTEEGKALGFRLRPVWTGFNGLFHEDWRRAGNMVVWDTGIFHDAPSGV